MVHTTCSVHQCTSSSKVNKELKFHQFPHDEVRCKQWVNACKRTDLIDKSKSHFKNKYLCSLHFEKCMYRKNRLRKMSFPTLFLPDTPMQHDSQTQTDKPRLKIESAYKTPIIVDSPNTQKQEDRSSQTVEIHTDNNTSSKRQLGFKLNQRSKRQKLTCETVDNNDITLEQFLKGCDKYLPPKFSAIVKTQLNIKPHYTNNRHTKEFKRLCLNLYYASPLAYRFFGKIVCLPSKTALANMYIPMSTKINEQMWEHLAATVRKMSRFERECILCMDKMSLKCSLFYDSEQDKLVGLHEVDDEQQPYAAEYAFTIMLRGIISDWKQPIGFSFISSKIDNQLLTWIINTVKKLFSLRFNVRALASNLGIDFVQFSKLLGITKEKTDFEIDGRKLYYIFDVPHLIKCVRNNLMKNNYEFEDKIVQWNDIQNLYDLDKTKGVRRAPRLTDGHLMPNILQKQKVRFASQVFSNSVKVALETYTASDFLALSDGTIEFIGFMNDLFDLLNSGDAYSAKPLNKAYRGDDDQRALLSKAHHIFNNLSVKNKITGRDVTKTMKFINAFLVTINSIRHLHIDMKSENFEYIFTRSLNNDCLENFFDVIRQASGSCLKPTCIQFTRAFRKSFLCQLMKLSYETNRTDDLDNILFKYSEFFKNKSVLLTSEVVADDKLPRVLPLDYNLPEENTFLYVCGYILRRCLENHKCRSMISYTSSYDDQSTSKECYLRQKDCNTSIKKDLFGRLQFPPDDFIEYCQTLEQTLMTTFTTYIGNNIGARLYHRLNEVNFSTKPCSCFPSMFMIKLFLRMRIHYIIKFSNRNLKTDKSKCRKYLSVAHL